MQFRARFVGQIIHFAQQQGVPSELLYQTVNKRPEELLDEDLFLSAGQYNAVVEQATSLSGNPFLGLHLGEYLSLSAAGLIVQIVQSSRTVLEALHYIVEFANLGCQAMPFRLVEDRDAWVLSLHPHPVWEEQSPVSVRQTMDGTMVFTLREFHTLTRQKHAPLAVHFCYDRPAKDAAYTRIFQCPIRFSQPYTQFLLDKRHVAEPVVTSDFQLLKLLVQYAEQKLHTLGAGSGFANQVKQTVIHLIKPQFPTINAVAGTLNISVRTLQRRLKEESYTYQQLLDELKRQFALDYLRNQNLSIKEIAYLLDYADASSFIRSFKRWKGKSPEQYRQAKA